MRTYFRIPVHRRRLFLRAGIDTTAIVVRNTTVDKISLRVLFMVLSLQCEWLQLAAFLVAAAVIGIP
jgi:hypothetical protein